MSFLSLARSFSILTPLWIGEIFFSISVFAIVMERAQGTAVGVRRLLPLCAGVVMLLVSRLAIQPPRSRWHVLFLRPIALACLLVFGSVARATLELNEVPTRAWILALGAVIIGFGSVLLLRRENERRPSRPARS